MVRVSLSVKSEAAWHRLWAERPCEVHGDFPPDHLWIGHRALYPASPITVVGATGTDFRSEGPRMFVLSIPNCQDLTPAPLGGSRGFGDSARTSRWSTPRHCQPCRI